MSGEELCLDENEFTENAYKHNSEAIQNKLMQVKKIYTEVRTKLMESGSQIERTIKDTMTENQQLDLEISQLEQRYQKICALLNQHPFISKT